MGLKLSDKNIIYGLVDPDTFEIRYVGKSTYGIARAKMHGQPAQLRKNVNLHKCNWIRKLHKYNKDYIILILHTDANADCLGSIETDIIKDCRQAGHRLLNQTDGGEGTCGRIVSDQTRNKISATKLGVKSSSIHCSNLAVAHGARDFVDQYGNVYKSIRKAAKELNIAASDICRVLKGKRYYVGGYSFKYL